MNMRRSFFCLLAFVLGESTAFAQEVEERDALEVDLLGPLGPDARAADEGMPVVRTACAGAEEFGGTPSERGAWCELQEAHYVGVRTLADKALAADELSFRAHYLMGVAQHLGEGNLPKALYHLNRAEQLFVGSYGAAHTPASSAPIIGYRRTMLELVYVHGEMDHHDEKIRYVDSIERLLGLDYSPLKAWPLLKLKRFEEARLVAEAALEPREGQAVWRAIGLTALCAVYSEMRDREKAYEACMAAAEPVLGSTTEGGVALSNAASSAIEVFRFDEAERLYQEATKRAVEGTINPWGRLAHLYLRQGRFPEAVSALREMQSYRQSRPAYFDQQDEADAQLTGAAVLMIAGRMKDALRIAGRTVAMPDRQGTSSASFDQNHAGNLIMARVAHLDVARRLEEEASYSEFFDSIKLRLQALELRFVAWIRGRRTAEILSDPERLLTSLRPECPGSVELATWLDAEVVRIVGPGVALATIARARAEETLPIEQSEPIFRAFEAEAHLLAGDYEEAFEAANYAVEHFHALEVLVRARAAAVAYEAARSMGDFEGALAHLEQVLAVDPGLLRRLGLSLPVQFRLASGGPAAEAAIVELRDSPLFRESAWGLQLAVGDDSVALLLSDGSELLRARVPKGPTDDVQAVARRIARAAHEELLVPKVDVTQADVRSLDGGMTGGGRASDRVKSILDGVLKP